MSCWEQALRHTPGYPQQAAAARCVCVCVCVQVTAVDDPAAIGAPAFACCAERQLMHSNENTHAAAAGKPCRVLPAGDHIRLLVSHKLCAIMQPGLSLFLQATNEGRQSMRQTGVWATSTLKTLFKAYTALMLAWWLCSVDDCMHGLCVLSNTGCVVPLWGRGFVAELQAACPALVDRTGSAHGVCQGCHTPL